MFAEGTSSTWNWNNSTPMFDNFSVGNHTSLWMKIMKMVMKVKKMKKVKKMELVKNLKMVMVKKMKMVEKMKMVKNMEYGG